LALALMVAQAFFYNAIFFTYALILKDFYRIPSELIGWYEIPFCLGNFLGSVLLGPLFDRVGRKPMIAGTYIVSALLLCGTGILFIKDYLTAVTQTACWSAIFFVSSASSSSAYLTISEIFPMESTFQTLFIPHEESITYFLMSSPRSGYRAFLLVRNRIGRARWPDSVRYPDRIAR
jgi:MFS family permease